MKPFMGSNGSDPGSTSIVHILKYLKYRHSPIQDTIIKNYTIPEVHACYNKVLLAKNY